MLLTLDEARAQARLPSDYPADQLTPYMLAAEAAAQEFCQRRIYASADDLNAATAALPGQMRAARQAYDQAMLAASEIDDAAERNAAVAIACRARAQAIDAGNAVLFGMVMTDDVKAALLLTFAHLFENRQENVTGTIVTELKTGVASLLWPHRVQLGV